MMKATALLEKQLTGVNAMLHAAAKDLRRQEWTSRPLRGENMPGFILWHIPRLQDHFVQVWIRGVPEVVQGERWARWDQQQPLGAGLGIPLEEADRIARCVQPAEVLAYADVVLREILHWLATLTDADLEDIPDVRKHLAPYPEYQTAGHHAEADDLLDLPIWRLLSGPCIGHVRGHLGELALLKAQLRASVRFMETPMNDNASARETNSAILPQADRLLEMLDLNERDGAACALLTPAIKARLREMSPAQVLEVRVNDPTARLDVEAWCQLSGNSLLAITEEAPDVLRFFVRKK